MKTIVSALFVFAVLSITGCAQNASWHTNQVEQANKPNFTVGEVQRNIREGMTNAEVAEVLGSPNVVSTDENGQEVWIYDKFHTENVVSASNGLTVGLSDVAGGASRSSQSTITVIIKFNKSSKVRDIAYHTSRF